MYVCMYVCMCVCVWTCLHMHMHMVLVSFFNVCSHIACIFVDSCFSKMDTTEKYARLASSLQVHWC